MKKEKSKELFGVLSIIITLLLSLNVYFGSRYSDCLRDVDLIRISKITPLYQELYLASSYYQFFYTNLNIQNYTFFYYHTNNGSCETTMKTKLPKECTQDLLNWPFEVRSKITSIETELNHFLVSCDKWNLWINITLFSALILNLLVIIFGGLIYSLYKT